MKPSQEQRHWVQTIINKWRSTLFLHKWYVETEYLCEARKRKLGVTAADVTILSDYFQCKICIYENFWEESEERREFLLLHELLHCITLESRQKAYDLLDGELVTHSHLQEINERLTQHLATIIFYAKGGNYGSERATDLLHTLGGAKPKRNKSRKKKVQSSKNSSKRKKLS